MIKIERLSGEEQGSVTDHDYIRIRYITTTSNERIRCNTMEILHINY